MKTYTHAILNANQAVAQMAFKTNEVFPIYPITPASEMSELVEQWSAKNKMNIYNHVPTSFQMQSESGVAGAMHGAIQTGSLSSTFTASQGLLLMLPSMYKIAGELTPNVIHVATRSIATHALSVFSDHSDIMAVRQSGYGMLGSASVQEAHDLALISQAASLESRIPFVHFFDGFRTSHETNKIALIPDKTIKTIIDEEHIKRHRNSALNPNNPIIRGTSQGPNTFFQSREASNKYFIKCPDIVQKKMNQLGSYTGRHYNLFDYVGHPNAQHIIISMASSCSTIEATVKQLNSKGHKLGHIKVRLFRPFSTKHLIKALPHSVNSIAVLDRTKEPGSTGEPLYLDILQSLNQAYQDNKIQSMPKIFGGRYGLSSKEFTPAMIEGVFKNLKSSKPKNKFTVGINDDVTGLSLTYNKHFKLSNDNYEAIFYHEKVTEQTSSFNEMVKLLGDQSDTFVQAYTTTCYKKHQASCVSHLRIGNQSINLPYLITEAEFVGCSDTILNNDVSITNKIKPDGTLLITSEQDPENLWVSIPDETKINLIKKNIKLFVFDETDAIKNVSDKSNSLVSLHKCFIALIGKNTFDLKNENIKKYIHKVNKKQVSIIKSNNSDFDTSFKQSLLGQMLSNNSNEIPVSFFPEDGTYPTNTSIFNLETKSDNLPVWNTNDCTQCGACSIACPQSALRIKAYDDSYLNQMPNSLKHIPSSDFDLMNYTIQINPLQCNGCQNCINACQNDALTEVKKQTIRETEIINWKYFKTIPELDRLKLNTKKISEQQLQEPLFKYANGNLGCGEMPYLKVVSQLFGDRMLIANATGSSSIFGGALPTTPWSKNNNKLGPAWSNSLFEDNAEFGLGFRMSINQLQKQAKSLLIELAPSLDKELINNILSTRQSTEQEISHQRQRISGLKASLELMKSPKAKKLLTIADNLTKKSVWIIGGDGWACDIGYSGLDHVLASDENVNILVLDNELYDNTGGQASKSTPFGAKAKFAFNGSQKQKKDLGLMALNYNNVYVASINIYADSKQALKALNEAESFNGPSIIIAYCHSTQHGINTRNPFPYHNAIVNSGQWLLYRNNPERKELNLNTLQLDSSLPTIPIEKFLKLESRFKNTLNDKQIVSKIQNDIVKRFEKFQALAGN